MRPNSSSAFLTSLILHGFVAALIFCTTIYMAHSEKVPVIFELVQGPGADPTALAAPAAGNTAMKVTVPKVELPPDKVEPQVQESPSVPETAPPKAETAPPKAVTSPKVKSDTSIAKQMNQSARMSYKDYLKKHPTPKPSVASATRAANVPKVDVQGVLGGAKGGSTTSTRGSGGKALTREEADELSTYISFLIQELKRAHEPPSGVSDQLETKVTFDITASGAILNPRITKTSGNREFDDSVLDAFRRMRSIGPTPNHRPDTWTVTFKMKDEA
jgi:TonB family protein